MKLIIRGYIFSQILLNYDFELGIISSRICVNSFSWLFGLPCTVCSNFVVVQVFSLWWLPCPCLDQASWSWFCAWDPNVEAKMCLPKRGKFELLEVWIQHKLNLGESLTKFGKFNSRHININNTWAFLSGMIDC